MQFQGSWSGLPLIFSLFLIFLQNVSKAAASQCKSTEILSDNGCVDREGFLNRIIMRSWKDQGFEKAKARAGLVDDMQCKAGEVRTPFGCAQPPFPPRRESARVPVHHSSLNRDQVVFSNFGAARTYYREPEVKSGKEKKKVHYSGPPISGHNRPRISYIMPGRLLRSQRKCRPYETVGPDGQCHRKKGKTGIYEHRNHLYGLQLRHRHEGTDTHKTIDGSV